MFGVWVTYYQEFESGGEPIDEDDQWTSYEDEYYSWDLGEVSLSAPTSPYNEIVRCGSLVDGDWVDLDKKEGEEVWVVSVVHCTGGTFGISHGHGCVVCACKDPSSAETIEREIRKGLTPKCLSSAPWNGHYESIEDIRVEKKVIRK